MPLVSAYSQCPLSVFECVGNIHIQSEVILKQDRLALERFLHKSYLDLLGMEEMNNKSNIFARVTEKCILSQIVYLVLDNDAT